MGTGLLESLPRVTRGSGWGLAGCVALWAVPLLYQEVLRGLGRAMLSWEGSQSIQGAVGGCVGGSPACGPCTLCSC